MISFPCGVILLPEYARTRRVCPTIRARKSFIVSFVFLIPHIIVTYNLDRTRFSEIGCFSRIKSAAAVVVVIHEQSKTVKTRSGTTTTLSPRIPDLSIANNRDLCAATGFENASHILFDNLFFSENVRTARNVPAIKYDRASCVARQR